MKKLLFIAFLSLFAACHSGNGNHDTTPSDSASSAPADTSDAVNGAVPDTAKMNRDQNHILGDTANMKHDTINSTFTH